MPSLLSGGELWVSLAEKVCNPFFASLFVSLVDNNVYIVYYFSNPILTLSIRLMLRQLGATNPFRRLKFTRHFYI